VSGPLIPVRATVAVMSTIVGLVLLLSFKTPDLTRPPGPVAVLASPAIQTSAAPADGSSSPSASPTAAAAARYKDGQFTGQDFPTEFGDNQVRVVIVGGRVTDVIAVQLPYDRARSAYITRVAGPILHDEVLKAQSAQIDSLSGATYTSYAYAQSVQSALDQAR
jgi:uncharacterized protein with FMN-binding domain